MGVEAINLYRAVVRVFTRGSDVRFFRCMFVNAWGRLLFNRQRSIFFVSV